MWKRLRIAVLLIILAVVAFDALSDKFLRTNWGHPIYVTVYPINADASDAADKSVAAVEAADFQPLEQFFVDEAHRYGIPLDHPVQVIIGDPVRELPPQIEHDSGRLAIVSWSLKARYWAWRAAHQKYGPTPTVRLFLLYRDPERTPVLPHSTGLEKGMFGFVNVFADRSMQGANLVVTAHELLHTLGATDKYDPATNQPSLPAGFAEPDRRPLYPQSLAELMAGRIPVSPAEATIPTSLRSVLVGPVTAVEIGWRKNAAP